MNANLLSINENSSHIVFITGGTKSGKSEFAEYLAKNVKNLADKIGYMVLGICLDINQV